MLRRVAALLCVAACSRGAETPAPPAPIANADGALAGDATALLELPVHALGMTELGGYLWRRRAGRTAYAAARHAEHAEDWAAVVTACKQALAADPAHLDAAWLLAVGLAKTGHTPDEIAAPLQTAVAGDLGKWGQASLDQPALQAFLATATGAAWQRRLDADRVMYAAALARSIVVLSGGDLFAHDPETARWFRLTRTGGAVIAALASPTARRLVYITKSHTHAGQVHHGAGIVDLATGHASHPIDVGGAAQLAIGWSTTTLPGPWIGIGGIAGKWSELDDDGHLHAAPANAPRPLAPWLEVAAGGARLHRLPVADVTADWDDRSLASSIRVGTSNRVVSVPSPGLIDGNSATWSPDHAQLAFVAQLDEQCVPGAVSAAAFVADAATGKVTELERAAGGLAIEWIDAHQLAIAGDHGVGVLVLGGAAAAQLDANASLPSPRRAPRCTLPTVTGAKPPDDEPPEDEVGDEPTDAGAPNR